VGVLVSPRTYGEHPPQNRVAYLYSFDVYDSFKTHPQQHLIATSLGKEDLLNEVSVPAVFCSTALIFNDSTGRATVTVYFQNSWIQPLAPWCPCPILRPIGKTYTAFQIIWRLWKAKACKHWEPKKETS